MSCGTQGQGAGCGLAPTYLDFIWPNLKGLDDAGQEAFHLPEVTVADAPGPIHQEDQVRRRRGRAAELGASWAAGRADCGRGCPCCRAPGCSSPGLHPWGWWTVRGHRAPAGMRRAAEFGVRSHQSQKTLHGPWSLGSAPLSPQRANETPWGPCASALQRSWQVRSLHGVEATMRGPFPLVSWPVTRPSGQRPPRVVLTGMSGVSTSDSSRALPRAEVWPPGGGLSPGTGSSPETKPWPLTGSGTPCSQCRQHPRPSPEPAPGLQGGSCPGWTGAVRSRLTGEAQPRPQALRSGETPWWTLSPLGDGGTQTPEPM